MRVSITTPTFGREPLGPLLYGLYRQQTYPDADLELVVYDDSPRRSAFWSSLDDPTVRYMHSPVRLTLGAKRDALVRASTGDVIVHFDDDDYYAPSYVATMVGHLRSRDLVTLSHWYIFHGLSQQWFYWATPDANDAHYCIEAGKPIRRMTPPSDPSRRAEWIDRQLWGYGFSYAFRRAAYEAAPFEASRHKGEDYGFVSDLRAAEASIAAVRDDACIAVHIIDGSNASRAFPNRHLPSSMAALVADEDVARYLSARGWHHPFGAPS